MLTPKQKAMLHAAQSAIVCGGVIYLYVRHRIPLDATCVILSGYGGVWTSVGAVLKLSGGGNVATPPAPVAPAPSTAPAEAPRIAPVPVSQAVPGGVPPSASAPVATDNAGAGLGPEHGAPS